MLYEEDYLTEKFAACNKEYEYSKMLDNLEKTEKDFNQTFGSPRVSKETRPHTHYNQSPIVTHGEIKTYNGESYIQIDGTKHKLDFNDPKSIGELVIKSIARHLLEES